MYVVVFLLLLFFFVFFVCLLLFFLLFFFVFFSLFFVCFCLSKFSQLLFCYCPSVVPCLHFTILFMNCIIYTVLLVYEYINLFSSVPKLNVAYQNLISLTIIYYITLIRAHATYFSNLFWRSNFLLFGL